MEKVSSHWVPHHFSKERSIKDAINTYKLASYCGALKKEKPIILAGICLRIAWLYRIKPKQGTRRNILKFALEEYEASYSTGDFSVTQVSEARILYLAGEILWKTGQERQPSSTFHSCPKKCPESLSHPDGQGPLSGTRTDPGNNPPFAAALIKKGLSLPGTAFYPP
ncbi:DUF2225 domain-containing protein [[Brevibacterium] frigoritolerans]|nr:DUF2225 domain-containing protein [Peribacillus frigoritolerans]